MGLVPRRIVWIFSDFSFASILRSFVNETSLSDV